MQTRRYRGHIYAAQESTSNRGRALELAEEYREGGKLAHVKQNKPWRGKSGTKYKEYTVYVKRR